MRKLSITRIPKKQQELDNVFQIHKHSNLLSPNRLLQQIAVSLLLRSVEGAALLIKWGSRVLSLDSWGLRFRYS